MATQKSLWGNEAEEVEMQKEIQVLTSWIIKYILNVTVFLLNEN